MRPGEGRVHEVTRVGMARMDRQLVACLDRSAEVVDVRDVELGLYALAEQVERQRDQVYVSGALAIAEEGALHALCARHQGELGGGDGRAPIVVRMHAED